MSRDATWCLGGGGRERAFALFLVVALCVPCLGAAAEAPPPSPDARAETPPAEAPETAAPPNTRVRNYLQGEPFAPRPQPRAESEEPAPPNPVLLWGRVVLYLAVLGAVLWLALHLVKKYLPGGQKLFASPGVEVLGRTHVDARRYIALVRVGERLLVVGVGPDQMRPLTEITDQAEVAEMLAVARPKAEAGKSLFQRLFETHIEKKDRTEAAGEATVLASDLETRLGTLRSQVKALRRAE